MLVGFSVIQMCRQCHNNFAVVEMPDVLVHRVSHQFQGHSVARRGRVDILLKWSTNVNQTISKVFPIVGVIKKTIWSTQIAIFYEIL